MPATLHDASGRTVPTATLLLDVMLDPFTSHSTRLPSVLRHRMSRLPSPSKSPMPATLHEASSLMAVPPDVTALLDWIDDPFMPHSTMLPSLPRHRMSARASPSKSPVP